MANEVPIYNGLLQSNLAAGGFQITGLGGLTLTAGDILLFQDPTLALHAATKQYVDGLVTGAALTAGRGIVIGAGPTYPINFAQNSDYTIGQIPFATAATTIGFSSDFAWDDVGKVMTVNGELATVTGIQFDMASPAAAAIGKLVWNDTDKTLEVQVSTDTTLQIGQEDHVYATNDSGAPMSNGDAVAMVGAVLGRTEIQLADLTPHSLTHQFVGVCTEDIANGADGFVTVRGFVRGLNTNAWNEGDILYLTGAGTYSNSAPAKPAAQIEIGIVVVKSLTDGIIYVRPNTYPIVEDLSDYVPDAGVQAGSIFLRDLTDSYWTDSGANLFYTEPTSPFAGNDQRLTISGVRPVLTLNDTNTSGTRYFADLRLNDDSITLYGWNVAYAIPTPVFSADMTTGIFALGQDLQITNTYIGSDLVALNGGSGVLQFFNSPNYKHTLVQAGNILTLNRPSGVPGAVVPNLVQVGGATGGLYTAGRLGILTGALPSFAGLEVAGDIRQTAAGGYTVRLNAIYGEMYQDDTGTTTTLTLQNTWYPLASGYTDAGGDGVTRGTATGRMTPTVAGVYKVSWAVSGNINANAQQIEIGILKNGLTIQANTIQEEQFVSQNTTYSCGGHGVVTFNGTTDYVQVAFDNNSSAGKVFTIDHVTLTLERIHE